MLTVHPATDEALAELMTIRKDISRIATTRVVIGDADIHYLLACATFVTMLFVEQDNANNANNN